MYENLPEQRFANLIEEKGLFSGFSKQIGFFDEDRIGAEDRAMAVIHSGDNTANFFVFENVNVIVVFVSKKSKSDDVDTRLLARNFFSEMSYLEDFGTNPGRIFSIKPVGFSSRIQLESGRTAYELTFEMSSNFCPS